jgi:hypothetical protein
VIGARVLRWATAFLFTQVVEIPIYRAGLGAGFWRAFGASAITHPLVWLLVVESGWGARWAVRSAAGETFAVVVEGLYLGAAFGMRRGFLWSLVANAASFLLALLAYALFGGLSG